MSSSAPTGNFNFPRPNPPPSDNHPIVIIVGIVSFGGLFLLGAFLLGIWCLVRRHYKKKEQIRKAEELDVDEHMKVQKMMVRGPRGGKRVAVSMQDDVQVHDRIRKEEIDQVGRGGLHAESKGASAGSSQQLRHPEELV